VLVILIITNANTSSAAHGQCCSP